MNVVDPPGASETGLAESEAQEMVGVAVVVTITLHVASIAGETTAFPAESRAVNGPDPEYVCAKFEKRVTVVAPTGPVTDPVS